MTSQHLVKFKRTPSGDYEAETAGVRFRIHAARGGSFALSARRLIDNENLCPSVGPLWMRFGACRERADMIAQLEFAMKARAIAAGVKP